MKVIPTIDETKHLLVLLGDTWIALELDSLKIVSASKTNIVGVVDACYMLTDRFN